MDILERLHQDSILEASRESDGSICMDNPVLQNPDRRNSIVVPYSSRRGSYEVPPSTEYEIMALGYPSDKDIFRGYGYINSFNSKYGVSNWVAELVTREQVNKKNLSRKYDASECYEDEKIHFAERVTLEDYRNSGYDKGHLAAASNHRYNSEAYKSTFCLRNIAPMHKNVNKILDRIEKQAQGFASDHGEVYIITGPVFYSKRNITYLNGKVAVPHAYFKVLVYKESENRYRIWPYLVKNLPDEELKDIKTARVKLALIECETELTLLPKLTEDQIIDDCYPKQEAVRSFGS